jgi:excisionase family DNA binding protein
MSNGGNIATVWLRRLSAARLNHKAEFLSIESGTPLKRLTSVLRKLGQLLRRQFMLTVKEAAAQIKCGTKFVYQLIREGKLKAHTLSARRTRIEEDDGQVYLNRYRTV